MTVGEQFQLTTVDDNFLGGKNLKTQLFHSGQTTAHPGQIAGIWGANMFITVLSVRTAVSNRNEQLDN